jgi:hypothetical protein
VVNFHSKVLLPELRIPPQNLDIEREYVVIYVVYYPVKHRDNQSIKH